MMKSIKVKFEDAFIHFQDWLVRNKMAVYCSETEVFSDVKGS